jgi:short-subunit dehydrogenase
MIARGRGVIINVSSRLALTASMASPPLPQRATYAATKAYINVFTQLLHQELAGTGVQVQALCPGIVATEFLERVGSDPGQFPAAAVMQPEQLVAASLAGVQLGEVICVPALEDASLMTHLQASERRVFEQSRSGRVATRYQV